ncbi:MAG: flagellar hook-associated protein FlgK [Ignavibacteria bacterium]|nr:MAG: flagellar hook-associated protein FlgK [Ignavibacteria bacterium]KAF0160152.1 MAG: flagellar hook-associated protein FlgK [Ignavibacteria bacterium]
MGIGRLLDLSVRTMSTYQSAIDIASQNISNAGSADYTRQKVVLASETANNGQGAGVKIQDVLRIRDEILDSQLRKYQSTYSDNTKRSEILQKIEALLGEPSDEGLSAYFTQFFNAWDELSANPTSTQLRLNVIQKAQQLSERYKDQIDGFSEIQFTTQREATVQVEKINHFLKEIHELNQKVYETEVRGNEANDLKDQRDKQINELSKLVNISVNRNSFGAVQVNVGGVYGADQTGFNQFKLSIINGQMKLVHSSNENAVAIVNGGEFNAIADIYSNKIIKYKADYETLATTFVNKVNEIHVSGNTLVNSGSSSTGIPFFGELAPGGSVINAFVDGKMYINTSILQSPKNIAASSTAGHDGNSEIANKIAALFKTKFSELGENNFVDKYAEILSSIGMDKVVADNGIKSGGLIMQNLETQKMSYSGVSIEEEMTNVMKYQRSFEAAAKLIKIADELLNTVINMAVR